IAAPTTRVLPPITTVLPRTTTVLLRTTTVLPRTITALAPITVVPAFTLALGGGIGTRRHVRRRRKPHRLRSRPAVRAERGPHAALDYPREEAARVLLITASHRGMRPDDRAYLVRLTRRSRGSPHRMRSGVSTKLPLVPKKISRVRAEVLSFSLSLRVRPPWS